RPMTGVLTDYDLVYVQGSNLSVVDETREGRAVAASAFMHPEFRHHFQHAENPDALFRTRIPALDYYGLCAVLFFVCTGLEPHSIPGARETLEKEGPLLKRSLGYGSAS